jgi:hypothetical protein
MIVDNLVFSLFFFYGKTLLPLKRKTLSIIYIYIYISIEMIELTFKSKIPLVGLYFYIGFFVITRMECTI